MDTQQLGPLYDLCREAAEVYPEPWRIFCSEDSEPIELRRAAFTALANYVELRLEQQAPDPLPADPFTRRSYICLGFLAGMPDGELDEQTVRRYVQDLVSSAPAA